MTVMDIAAKVTPSPLENPHNVLYVDIERIPGRARVKHRGLVIEGDFWDLSGWKHTIGYRIHPDDVIEWPRTICGAWNWYGQDRVHFAAEWLKGGREQMLKTLWNAYDRAQLVIGHNLDSFDTKKLNGEWALMGFAPPSPFKSVDTLKVARAKFGFESNTLDSLCKRFGIDAKTDRYSVEMARGAVAGNRAKRAQIKGYNCGDIAAGRGFYDHIRVWHHSHPHSVIGTSDDRKSCNNCWTTDPDAFEPNGYKLANQIIYPLWRCRCGANIQGTRHSRAAITRGAS